ncbi:chromosome partitioning protein ParA [Bizionia myxarmorum]|uniref:Chromosome partitioning protein ParA n=1 Tax=Bizionia myxarmorum TaxID=291186 RepID=A0A5D0R4I5_9FLAO|nr:chromosome partitioning protein ParA [Bizionia myxarmorum]TYB76382.1 chromosome partitioning protein ParA [Bizionia myxarmorum]
MENNKNSTGLKVALGIALVLFVATGIYTSKLYKEKKSTEAQLLQEKEMVMTDLTNMAKQYDVVIGENEISNEKLVEAKARIQGLIDSLKVSETNIQSLYRYKSKYTALQKEMDVLLRDNERLKNENQYLSTSLDSTRTRLQERTMFTDSLLVQNTALAEVVSNASVLGAVGLKGNGVIERTSGKLIPTESARRADKISVCFTVPRNTLVKAGDHELYIQVIDPKNNTLGANEQIEFGDKVLNYSIVSKFNYENASLNICEFISPKGNNFEKGRYVVNVYNQKDLVSTTEFTID